MNDFKINSLLDLRKRLALTSKMTEKNSVSNENCSKHGNPLKAFCETCNEVICFECTKTDEHNAHDYSLIIECYPKHHKELQASLDVLQQTKTDVDRAITHLTTRMTEVPQQGEQVKEEINTHAQQIIDMVQRSRTHLTKKVDTKVEQTIQLLTAQVQYGEQLRSKLKTCHETIERSLKECTKQQILSEKHAMMKEINSTIQSAEPKALVPVENAGTTFAKTTVKDVMIGHITTINNITTTLEASPCLVNEPSSATLTFTSQDGSPCYFPPTILVGVNLCSASDTQKCGITKIQPGKYDLTFTPLTRQDHLKIQLQGIDAFDTSLSFPIIPLPEMRGKLVKTKTGLRNPWGIGVLNNGSIVVAENSANCLTSFTEHGKSMQLLLGKVIEPRGIAISIDGHILVTDNHRLQKFTAAGVLKATTIGQLVSFFGGLPLNFPTGIAVHPTTGQIFVADTGNNRIQVFNNDLTFSRMINARKTFDQPCDVALDTHGHLYVADFNNHCIKKIVAVTGNYIASFGSFGHASGQLYRPSAVTISNDLVYVCERANGRISIFDMNGEFVYCFGKAEKNKEGVFRSPRGIAADASGVNIYVSDIFLNTISIL